MNCIALLLSCLILAPVCLSIEDDDWQPILATNYFKQTKNEPSFSSVIANRYQQPGGGQCELYKVGFTQDLYFQYIQYKNHMPDLKEFTLCYWSKFSNHSNDHPLFSYAVENEPRAILAWISNTDRSSYFSLSVQGHTFYRLNYPLRLNRWYHTCQSWNGRTGEWQIWVNAERVGRGFHNRLVGSKIRGGGIAITGQEQSQVGGGFQEGQAAPKGSGGMLGEVTMVQLYSVALTAGKAHRDHKHHHAHKYDHNGNQITTTPPPQPAPRPMQPTHPLLTAGQINPEVALNIAAQQQQLYQFVQQQPQQQDYASQFFGNQYTVPPQQTGPLGQGPQVFQQQQQRPLQQLPNYPVLPGSSSSSLNIGQQSQSNIGPYSQQTLSLGGRPLINSGLVHSSIGNSANVQYDDETLSLETHQLFKRESKSKPTKSRSTKATKSKSEQNKSKRIKRRTNTKRELYLTDGHLVGDSLIGNTYEQSLLDGLAGIGESQPLVQLRQKENDEREPAEAEVKAVMSICNGCDEEPFGKALVFDWRTVPKKLYSGAFYQPAIPECRVF